MVDGADEVRRVILERFDCSLGAGLGRLQDRVFRIGHLGDFNDLMLAGTLWGVQMGLQLAGHDVGDGVSAAVEVLKCTRCPGSEGAGPRREWPGRTADARL